MRTTITTTVTTEADADADSQPLPHTVEEAVLARILMGAKPWAAVAAVTGRKADWAEWVADSRADPPLPGGARILAFVERVEAFQGTRQAYLTALATAFATTESRVVLHRLDREFPGDFGERHELDVTSGGEPLVPAAVAEAVVLAAADRIRRRGSEGSGGDQE